MATNPTIDLRPVALETIPYMAELRDKYAQFQLLDYEMLQSEMAGYGVPLNEDPSAASLTELNTQIAKVDAQKTRVANILSSSLKNENDLESLYRQIEQIYKREFDSRLIQSPVKDFSNKESRESACNTLLAPLKELLDSVNGSLISAKAFTKIVYHELGKLDSTNKNISRQITVLQTQIEIGEIQRTTNMRNNEF